MREPPARSVRRYREGVSPGQRASARYGGSVAVVAKRADRYVGGFRWKRLILPLVGAVTLCAMALAADVAFADRALPRVTVAGVEIGGLQAPELGERLTAEAAGPWASAGVVVQGPDGLVWTTTNADLAITPDVDRAVADALAYGHTGSLPQRLSAWANALRGHAAVPFAMRSDAATVDAWVRTVATSVDRPAADGAMVATFHGLDVTPAVVGRETDRAALRHALLAADTRGDRSISLEVHLTYPA